MIKVLIVDDVDGKVQEIRRVLTDRCQIPEEQIDTAMSVSSGIRAMINDQYQLLILDLVLPQFEGESLDEKGGLSILKDINENPSIKRPVQVICLTAYAEIISKNQEEFNQLLISSVVKKEGDTTWIDKLAEQVNQTIRLHNHLADYFMNKDTFDVGIICALQEEFDQLLLAFGAARWRTLDLLDLPYQFKTCTLITDTMNELCVIAACAGGAGIAPTATLSAIMFCKFHVNQLYMTGFTGGVKNSAVSLGDILVSKAVLNYPVGKVIDTPDGDIKLLKEMQQIPVNSKLMGMMADFISQEGVVLKINQEVRRVNLQVREREEYRVQCVPTVCVPFVLGSLQIQGELKEDDRKLSGIDMEGFALYFCANHLSRQALWIKGVSDMADGEKDDKYHKTCAFGSAYLLYMFLKTKF